VVRARSKRPKVANRLSFATGRSIASAGSYKAIDEVTLARGLRSSFSCGLLS
jgi:hypothetical protein